ncbi:MAG: xanthine dehydrogenase family protein molybdopterin-binding subunit, partial [Myxococcales bacterium]
MGARDKHGHNPPWGRDFNVVGKPHQKVDGLAKATGQALYADDLQLPGMLHAKTLRSTVAHARIKAIDASKALALPGVKAVITGRDLPITYGVIPWTQDENALALDKVRFIGDPVAAVAAIDEDTANRALKLIDVEYEPLHAFLDPFEALARPEPAIHASKKGGNVSKHVQLEFGEVDKELAGAALVVEDEYFFHGTTHAPIEPHCAVAQYGADGLLTVWSATQITHYVHRALAKVLELPAARIRVVQPCLGGAFGGKSDPFSLEFCVAKLAMLTGRPVKMLWTREEVFYAHRGRHPMHMNYRTGVDADGRIQAVALRMICDGGAYGLSTEGVMRKAAILGAGPYNIPNLQVDTYGIYTNNTPSGAFRSFGALQTQFATESHLDICAE